MEIQLAKIRRHQTDDKLRPVGLLLVGLLDLLFFQFGLSRLIRMVVWVVDRTDEFRDLSGTIRGNKSILELPQFIQNAYCLVSQCEDLEMSVRHFIAVVDSLDLLLYPDSPDCVTPVERREARSYHGIMQDITHISTCIHQLQSSSNGLDDYDDEKGVTAFRKGIAAYLYARVSAITERFKQAEACRLEREFKLQNIFATSGQSLSCPPLKPLESSDPILSLYLVGFLPPRWQQILRNAITPILERPSNFECASDPSSFGFGSQNDIPTVEDVKIGVSPRRPPDRSIGRDLENKRTDGGYPVDDLPEDICRDLAIETQQLLLERDVDTVDELHVRNVQQHLRELSVIDSFFANKVLEQQEICENVVDTMEGSVAQMADASQELTKAEKRGSSYRTLMIGIYVVAAFILLLGDFLTSSKRY